MRTQSAIISTYQTSTVIVIFLKIRSDPNVSTLHGEFHTFKVFW